MQTRFRRPVRRAGFTLVEIMIVILIIGALLNIAAPAFVGARDKSQARSCVKNLSDFATAKEQFAMDTKASAGTAASPAIVWAQIKPYIKVPSSTDPVKGPLCPTQGDQYNFQPLAVPPTCPYGQSQNNPLAIHSL